MDNIRLILYLSLGFVALMLWQAWLALHQPPPAPGPTPTPAVTADRSATPADVPSAGVQISDDPPAVAQQLVTPVADQLIQVQTDVLTADINLRGGEIQGLDLRQIRYDRSADSPPFRLLKKHNDGNKYVMQSGLLHDRLPALTDVSNLAPSHHADYQSGQLRYTLAETDDVLRVPLRWRQGEVEVEKIYLFRRGSYLIEIEHHVYNAAATPWIGRQYAQLRRTREMAPAGNKFIYTFTGATYYDGSYHKADFDDIADQPLAQTILGGWAAMIEHYFVSGLIPLHDQTQDYYTKSVPGERGDEFIIGMRSQPLTVAGSGSGQFKTRLYAGPKIQSVLEQIAPGLELTVDYGIFTVISKPLFWLLEKVYAFLGNWGWAIAVVTLLIKLVFYKLSEASYRSMAKMRKFQPRLTVLRERYGDDRQRLNQEMMALYKREKVNPLGGCLPILVQIPVFIALYWVLIESVELRHAPFILWIDDLSSKDPFFVLPLLMGVTMFIQNRLNPTPPDPIQAKVMMFLPLIFTVFFAFFPAGLVLYWLVNNLLSISQQWVITRQIERAD